MINVNIIDTGAVYRRLLAEPDVAKREAVYREELALPYAGLAQIFGGRDAVDLFRQWNVYTAEAFGGNDRQKIISILDRLKAYDAWNKIPQALSDAQQAFAPYSDQIPLKTVQVGLFVTDPGKAMPLDRGYSGFGGVPGYIMMVYSDPNDYNLPRLQGATVHELHHNIRFTLFPFSMNVTVGEYIIAEGLAESFAAELYGKEVVGYYVTEFNDAELTLARQTIGNALDVSGFNQVRGYIFGDVLAEQFGFPKAGVPNYAGYAIGYRIVQEYLKRTGKSVAEATFVPARELIAESRYFEGVTMANC